MAPRKKTPTMIWVRKSQQPENMETEKMKSPLVCSPLLEEVSNSQPSPLTEMTQPTTNDHTLSKPDWSLLPEELLYIVSEKLENCFDVIHARSVCQTWRSIFAFPSCLLRTSYSLPSFSNFPHRSKGLCTLEKFHMFFFRVRASAGVDDGLPSKLFIGGINRDKSEDHMELPSPFQCSLKVKMPELVSQKKRKIPESELTLVNVLGCQILPLRYQFRMLVGFDSNSLATSYRRVAFLPLDKLGGKEFVVLIDYAHNLLVLRSSEMRWIRLEQTSVADCKEIVTFRGKFYAVFINGDIFVIDAYTLKASPLMLSERLNSVKYLVPSGDDELFLVERMIIRGTRLNISNSACRVSRLDEDAGELVVVTDLGDRVLLIGEPGYSSCSAKELPHGCGVSGNSFLFTNEFFFNKAYFYKYGIDTGNAEDDLNLWRCSKETIVTILDSWPMVALQIESSKA